MRVSWCVVFLQAIVFAAMIGCDASKPTERQKGRPAMNITVTSKAFAPGQAIPREYTGEGDDISPPLRWTGAPSETQELVLICDDPDAPRPEPWVHWVIYGIPLGVDALPAGVDPSPSPPIPSGAKQGVNSWEKVGYGGPLPPRGHGAHHYHFKLYALDTELDLAAGLSKESVLEAIAGHVLAEGELIGTYERK